MITRNWINPSAKFVALGNTYSIDDLHSDIDYWKNEFIKEGVQPGQKIGLSLAPSLLDYISASFAAFELGIKVVVLPKIMTERDCDNPKVKLLTPLDAYVTSIRDYDLANERYMYRSKKIIHQKFHNKLKSTPTPITCEPSDMAIMCTSSGSTGHPKLVEMTHAYLHQLCSVNWSQLGFTQDDKVLHLTTFSHGSSLSIYFLPALKACGEHHLHICRSALDHINMKSFMNDFDTNFVKYCSEFSITKVMSPNTYFTERLIKSIENSDGLPDTTLMVLSFINPRWLNVVKSGKLKKIVSVFGASEIGGPLFLPYIDKDTENFDPKFLGEPCEGFFKTKSKNGMLVVTLPNGGVVKTQDHVDDTFHFIRKDKLKRVNGVEINPLDIQELLDPYISRSKYEIVVDEITNSLYMVVSEQRTDENKLKFLVTEFYGGQVELKDIVLMDLQESVLTIKPEHDILLHNINKDCRGR